tara:strand:- start:125 stop:850 length:726 start_codon:yes stop_codon:yes gene_type:complete
MKINNINSPNFDKKKRSPKSIKLVVIHYTGMQSERESIDRLCSFKFKVSAHFVINRNGTIYRLVKDTRIAWHAGKSCWGKFKNLNKNSIGIELINKGHEFGYTNFKKKQIKSLVTICKELIRKYKIKNKNIVGHSDISPLRKKDPGEKFPWKYLAYNGIGLWHNFKPSLLKKFRKEKITASKDKKKFVKNLEKIGYCYLNKHRLNFSKVLKAFQRHHRKELVNGVLDKECFVISQNLLKNL